MGFDLSDPVRALKEMAQAILDLQTATPLANASLGRGILTVYDGGIILIDNGGLKIVGWADILGSLEVTGQINGTGDLNWAGKAFFDGPMEITDTLKVLAATTLEGLVQLKNNLELITGGKIKAGNIEINPTDNGGVIKIGTARIWVNGSQFEIQAGSWQIWTDATGICIGSRLGAYARFTGSAIQFVGIGTVLDTTAPAGSLRVVSGNVVTTRQT